LAELKGVKSSNDKTEPVLIFFNGRLGVFVERRGYYLDGNGNTFLLLENKLRMSFLRIGNVSMRVRGKVGFNSLPTD
jgi:hypothetical protein